MNWIFLSLLSAVFLGFYDIAKKAAVRDNAVPPVLLLNVLTAALIWGMLSLISQFAPKYLPFDSLQVQSLSMVHHPLMVFKSLLAGSSWIFALYAMKHLPMSIAAPIRSGSPFFTILIAVVLIRERPTAGQWAGVSVILISFYAFATVGRKEGIHFHRDRWVGCMVLATILGACSALYDKYLLQSLQMPPSTVQAWFSIYLVPVMIPLSVRWYHRERRTSPFQWRWSIPWIAVLLLISDFLYFTAINDPDALISIISPVRRTSLIIAFLAGVILFGEKNWRPKAVCIASLLAGVYLMSLTKT